MPSALLASITHSLPAPTKHDRLVYVSREGFEQLRAELGQHPAADLIILSNGALVVMRDDLTGAAYEIAERM